LLEPDGGIKRGKTGRGVTSSGFGTLSTVDLGCVASYRRTKYVREPLYLFVLLSQETKKRQQTQYTIADR
jgi:hypothetical protein